MEYIPKETYVKSTSLVINKFDKPKGDEILEDQPKQPEIPQNQMNTV